MQALSIRKRITFDLKASVTESNKKMQQTVKNRGC